jgi:hypothetical protein
MHAKPPDDAAEHAVDFARRWADRLDVYSALRMEELGIPLERIGSSDYEQRLSWRAFFPEEEEAGGVATGGRINIDSGVLNPNRMNYLPAPAPVAWTHARLRDRIDAAIAHEDAEWRHGSHEAAVEYAPKTELPISQAARTLLTLISLAEQAIPRGDSIPPR